MANMSFDQLVEMLTLQDKNLPTYQAEVGATNAELVEIAADLANLNYLKDYADLIDANKKTVFQIKQAVYNGDPDEPVAVFPNFPAGAAPNPLVGGALPRANERNRRYKAAAGYTEEIGVAIGIAGGGGEAPDPSTVQPDIEVFAAQTGGVFSVVVTGRAESDSWQVQVAPVGTTNWTNLATATGKSTDVTYSPPGGLTQPVQLQVRVQLRKSNANYGQLSDISLVTVNP